MNDDRIKNAAEIHMQQYERKRMQELKDNTKEMNFDDGNKVWWLVNDLGARIKFTKLEDGSFDVFHLGGCMALPIVKMTFQEAKDEYETYLKKGWKLEAWG